MEILVVYDVATASQAGPRRLRRVAKACEGFGQRVQNSVFECTLNDMQLEQLRTRLKGIINVEQDSLRIYRLMQPRTQYVEEIGRAMDHDLHDPLII